MSNIKNLNFNKISTLLYLFFIVLVFFPWVSFRTNSMDTQPWIFIFGSMFIWIFIKHQKDFSLLLFFLLLPIISQFIAILFGSDFDLTLFLRGFAAYSIFIYVYIIQKNNLSLYSNFYKLIFIINLLYLFVGIVQLMVSPLFFDWIVVGRMSESRGVSSLSPEPTSFGLFLLILSVVHLVSINRYNKKKVLFIIFLNVVFILFIAQSTTASLYLLVAIVMLTFSRVNIIITLLMSISGGAGILYLLLYGDSRISTIFTSIINGEFFNSFLLDESIFDRIMATIYPFVSFYENLFIPGGFYLSSSLRPVDMSWIDSSLGYYHTGDKIMSLWGGVIAETGIIGFFMLFFIIIILVRKIKLLPKMMRMEYYFIFIFIFLLGFSSISLSLAPIPFVVALIISKIDRSIKYV
jgi:hypothetical protein